MVALAHGAAAAALAGYKVPSYPTFTKRPYFILKRCLTPNTQLIQLWCAQSKLNMNEILLLKHSFMICRYTKEVLLKSLHAQERSFLLLTL